LAWIKGIHPIQPLVKGVNFQPAVQGKSKLCADTGAVLAIQQIVRINCIKKKNDEVMKPAHS